MYLTGKTYYRKAKNKIKTDFVNDPDHAADVEYTVPIILWGMETGISTGEKPALYINADKVDYENTRKMINRGVKTRLIALYTKKFRKISAITFAVTKEF